MALGIAVMGSIGTVIYRNRMDVPDGIPNEAAESASDTLVRYECGGTATYSACR